MVEVEDAAGLKRVRRARAWFDAMGAVGRRKREAEGGCEAR